MSLLLSEKVEGRLRTIFEERQFTNKDAVLLVILIGIAVTLIGLGARYGFVNILMALFLFSYCMLLFLFTYVSLNEQRFLAVVPPAVFILLYFLLRGTSIWSVYLVNVYAIIFAVLVILYLGSLFTWKATWVFAILITILDVVQVFITGVMVEAAETGVSLQLPVMVAAPVFPSAIGLLRLGLGDFFLSGLLSIQTLKKYGKKPAVLSAATIAVVFFMFEIYLLNYFQGYFPATLIVILGWLPVALWKILTADFSPTIRRME
ncbi:MAG: hypothetical protein QXQ47_05700 [Candidatus Bathyarchaeia archaeon]